MNELDEKEYLPEIDLKSIKLMQSELRALKLECIDLKNKHHIKKLMIENARLSIKLDEVALEAIAKEQENKLSKMTNLEESNKEAFKDIGDKLKLADDWSFNPETGEIR